MPNLKIKLSATLSDCLQTFPLAPPTSRRGVHPSDSVMVRMLRQLSVFVNTAPGVG
jgi:hypothetical protein